MVLCLDLVSLQQLKFNADNWYCIIGKLPIKGNHFREVAVVALALLLQPLATGVALALRQPRGPGPLRTMMYRR